MKLFRLGQFMFSAGSLCAVAYFSMLFYGITPTSPKLVNDCMQAAGTFSITGIYTGAWIIFWRLANEE